MTADITSPGLNLDGRNIRFSGSLIMTTLGQVNSLFQDMPGKISASSAGELVFDLDSLKAIDTGGAHLVIKLRQALETQGHQVRLIGNPVHLNLIDQIAQREPSERPEEDTRNRLTRFLENTGQSAVSGGREVVNLIGFFGLVLSRFGRSLLHPSRFRVTALVHHMQAVGLSAVPIVCLISFLIGIVLAYMGSIQLRTFGAEVFVVNLVSVAVLRELGIMLTAIVVAGRSGSAFTAAIGSMKVREEIDAMQTLGLDPIEVLVLPRILALLITLPILGFIADIMGLLGGGLMSWTSLGVSPGMFITRLQETTDVWHYVTGLIKAPFFALIIGLIGCYQGFQVSGSSDSVGQMTTTSVVRAIFMVIIVDAIFAILFVELGI